MSTSPIQAAVSRLPARSDVDSFIDALTDDQVLVLRHDWSAWARPEQLPPDTNWRGWLILAGRGSGKTRAGAEWVLGDLKPDDHVALVAPTAADVRDVMVKGSKSGILDCAPPWNRPEYEPSKRLLTWPNGAVATTYSADEPDRLRGPQHTKAWADEVAAWRYGPEAWANLMMTLRIGANPQWLATTTPKPVRLVRDLLAAADYVTRMTSYENAVNLAPAFFNEIVQRYEGTRLGRQELLAELLEDVPGALWTRAQLDASRTEILSGAYVIPPMTRIVVAVDPAVTSGEGADMTGIVVVGRGENGLGYVLEDLTCRKSPQQWAWDVVRAYERWNADRVVAEVNNGGELVETVLRAIDAGISYTAVHASRGKRTRAEPIAALYEQGRVKHAGVFPDLEDQMCMYVPDVYDGSPDRVDALVWGLTETMLDARRSRFAFVDSA